MPKPSPYVRVPVVLAKLSLPLLANFRGKANAAEFVLAGVAQPVSMVSFVTFAGALDESDGLYHGHYLFEVGDFAGRPTADLSALPSSPRVELPPESPPVTEKHDGV